MVACRSNWLILDPPREKVEEKRNKKVVRKCSFKVKVNLKSSLVELRC